MRSPFYIATSGHFSNLTALLPIGLFDKTVEPGSLSIHILQVRPVNNPRFVSVIPSTPVPCELLLSTPERNTHALFTFLIWDPCLLFLCNNKMMTAACWTST